MKKEFLWVEKYRPLNIDDCILPKSLIRTFREFVNNNEIPNLLLCGTAGVGKTRSKIKTIHINEDGLFMSI